MSENRYDDAPSEGPPIPSYYQVEDSPSYHEIDKRERQPVSSSRHLGHCHRFSYGVGHVLNDLTASMWFSYLLVFLHQVCVDFC